MKRTLMMVITLVLVGCMAMPVLARGGGGGRGGGGRGGYGGGYYGGRGYYGGYGLWYGGLGYGGYGGYRGYGGYYDGGTYYPYYGDVTPYYAPPSYQMPPATASLPAMAPITLEVILPDPQAQLWLDGTPTTMTGVDRIYVSPPMEVGYTYVYDVRATWNQGGQPVTVDRRVQVMPGRHNIVDLRGPAPATISTPANQ